MAIQQMELDPDAQAYTDDEIVGKVNAATAAIVRESALSQDDLNIVKTSPASGDFKIKNVQRKSTGKVEIDYDDVAVS